MAWMNLNARVTPVIIIFLALITRELIEAIINRAAKTGTDVVLICDTSNYTKQWNITWVYEISTENRTIASCHENKNCRLADEQDTRFEVAGNSTVSELNVSSTRPSYLKLRCLSDTAIIQSYNLRFIDPADIKPPKCHISPITSDITKRMLIKYTCQSAYASQLTYLYLTSGDVGYKFRKSTRTNTTVIEIADYRAFLTTGNISCELSILGTDISRSCLYPNLVNASYDTDDENGKNDAIIKCDFGSQNVIVSWSLIASDEGDLEDIQNRSWTKNGGRSLLLRDITAQDDGKVVECRASNDGNRTIINAIGYSLIGVNVSKSNETEREEPQPNVTDSIFLVLTLLFLALWLITCAVGGICLFCREKMKPTEPDTSSTSRDASVPSYQLNECSHAGSNVNRDSGQRDTPLVNIGARGNTDTSNTNNSANNPAFELEVDATDEKKLRRQSNSEIHLYFTLEQPSPLNKSSQRASTLRKDRHGDTNPASLNQPQSSASYCQGYEIVGESNKGATCQYDLGEYAEVGDHIIGRGPPIIRQKPGREEVKEDDMSRLYSKVKK